MAITITQPGNPAQRRIPTKPEQQDETPKNIQKEIKDLRKKERDLAIRKRLIERRQKAEQEYEDISEKSSLQANNFICALRLDMVADKLENIDPRWSKELDAIADAVEHAEWERN